jgi:hypothetical protein
MENMKNAGKGKLPIATITFDYINSFIKEDIKGKDLISLCLSNKHINNLCNRDDQKLFRDRLPTEFSLNWNIEKYDFATPRDLYIQMSKKYYEISEIFDDYGRHIRYSLVESPGAQKRNPGIRTKLLIPNSDWPNDVESFYFYFPDVAEISFVVHLKIVDDDDDDDDNDVILTCSNAEGIKGFFKGKDLDEFINDFMWFEGEFKTYYGYMYEGWDWLFDGFNVPLSRRLGGDVLYVWKLFKID